MIIETRIQGPHGCGKTTALIRQLQAQAKQGRRCLLVVPTPELARFVREQAPKLVQAGVEVQSAYDVFQRGGLESARWDVVALDNGERFPIAVSGALAFAQTRVREYYDRQAGPDQYAARYLVYTCY